MSNIHKTWGSQIDIRQGKFDFDFKLIDYDSSGYGDTTGEPLFKVYIYLVPHESIDNIINTINHETFHAALDREQLHVNQEHIIIRHLSWYTNGVM